VRTYKIIAFCYYNDRTPATAHTGVNDTEMHGSLREIAVGGFQCKGSFPHILGRDFVGNIDDQCLRVYFKDDSFYACGKSVSPSKITRKCYNGGHGPPGTKIRQNLER